MLRHETLACEGVRREREAFELRQAGQEQVDRVVHHGQDLNLVDLASGMVAMAQPPLWRPVFDHARHPEHVRLPSAV